MRDRLEALVDGDLDPAIAAALRAHLAACAACRAHHAEASSLPSRLAAIRAPEPPENLVAGVLRRVGAGRVGKLRLWGPLSVEAALLLVALWYVSGVEGLYALVERTASDAGALLSWGAGLAEPPAAPTGDAFLLLLCGLLLVTTLYHLALLSRHGPRLS